MQYINLIFPLARFKNRQSMKTDLFIWKRGGMTQHFALWVCESVSPSPPWLGHNETCRYKTKRVGLEERKWVLWWSSTGDEITGRLYEKDQNTTSAKHRERHEKEKWSSLMWRFLHLSTIAHPKNVCSSCLSISVWVSFCKVLLNCTFPFYYNTWGQL